MIFLRVPHCPVLRRRHLNRNIIQGRQLLDQAPQACHSVAQPGHLTARLAPIEYEGVFHWKLHTGKKATHHGNDSLQKNLGQSGATSWGNFAQTPRPEVREVV